MPVARSYTRAVSSWLVVMAIGWPPTSVHATASTLLVWPAAMCSLTTPLRCHTRAVLSWLVVIGWPSNSVHATASTESLWPVRVARRFPLAYSTCPA